MTETIDEITGFLSGYPAAVAETALELRAMIISVMPDAREMLDSSARIIGYGFGPGYTDLICTIIPSKKGVKLGIARGAELQDPHGLLEGTGKRHRHVAITKPADLKRPGLKQLLRTAITAWKHRTKRVG